MKKLLPFILILLLSTVAYGHGGRGGWRQGAIPFSVFHDQTYNQGTPALGTGNIYVVGKDIFFIDSDGTATSLISAGFADPLTTRGDIIYRDASSTTRLPLGANGLVLKSDGTDISWDTDATGAGSGAFSDAGDPVVLNTPAKNVEIGDTGITLDAKLQIGGDTDEPQVIIEGHSTQTDSPFIVQQDDETQVATIEDDGTIFTAVGIDGIGAIALVYGSGDITSHTLTTDSTGTAEIVLPAGAIDSTEILDDTIANADMADNSINSAEYVDGSIDTAHYAAGSVDVTAMGADSVGESELIEAMNFTGVGTWRFNDVGTGAHGAFDLNIGPSTTYGALNIGNFGLYSSSFSSANLDLDKAILFRQEGNIGAGNDPGIEFCWMEQGNTVRMAIPESAVGNATAMIRSVTIAGPYTNTLGNTIVQGDTWTTFNDNLDFDTSGTGADLFVQDDLELEGTLFVSGGDIRLDSDDANPLIISATSQTASHTFDFPDDEIVSTDIMIGDGAGSFVYAPMSGGATMTNAGVVTIVTNANLTGHVISTGNAALLGSFTEAQLETAVSDDNPLFDGDIGSNVQAWDAELDTIAALTETNGNVMFVAGGAWTSDPTPAIDGTDITNVTAAHTGTITWGGTSILETGPAFQFGDGTDATVTHTYGNTGTDVTIAYSTAAMGVTGALTATNLSGTNTGDNTVATSGDAALDFFGGGVTAVTDGTACTDIEGTGLSIGTGTLNISGLTNAELSGTAGITNANLALTAGRSLTEATNDILADAELYTDVKTLYMEDPVAESLTTIWVAPLACTITKIHCESDQTVTFDFQIDDGTPAAVNGSDIVCTTFATDSSLAGDTSMAAGDRLDLVIASVSGTPTWFSGSIELTFDD